MTTTAETLANLTADVAVLKATAQDARDDIAEIKRRYDRLPVWATMLLSLETGLIGALLTALFH